MMKCVRMFAVAVAAVMLFGGSAIAKTTWDFYSFLPVSHPVVVHYQKFADDVRKRTNGELEIVVRPAGELPYSPTEGIRVFGRGQVPIGGMNAAFIQGSAPLLNIFGLPFLVQTYEDYDKAWKAIGPTQAEMLKKEGIVLLGHFSWPPQEIWGTGNAPSSMAGVAGLKIRTSSPHQTAMLTRMKASGITIATAEVPVALQRGVVNGVMTAGYNARGSKWGEFLDWGYLLHEHMAGPHYVVANERAFNRLSAELQGQLRDEAEKLGARIHADMNNNESSALKDLVATYNITLVEPSAADRKQMLDMMVPYWEEWAKQQGAEGERQLAILRKAMGR